MGENGRFMYRTPALRFRNGKVAVHIPEYITDEDSPLEVNLECPKGNRTIGNLPLSGIPGTSSPAFVVLDEISPLDGFSILIDGNAVYECPRTDALYFGSEGMQIGEPDGPTTVVRRPGSGPDIADPISVIPLCDAEAVGFVAPSLERRFEISRPSIRFRDGVSYLYVARYIGVPGDPFRVTIEGDFGRFELGMMPSKTTEGKHIASGTEFRLTDHGITVLDWFDVMIDGRKVFSFPQRDILVFSERGTVTAFPLNRAVVVFLDDVMIESNGECLVEYSHPSGILYRLYEAEGPIFFGSSITDDSPEPKDGDTTDDLIPGPAAIEEDVGEVPYIPEPEVEEIPREPETDPYPEVPSGSFARLTPRMVLRESGILRRVCILVPEYRPITEIPAMTAVQDGKRIDMGPLPMGRWVSKETIIGIQSYGIDPLETFSLELEGRTIFSSQGTNALFFTTEGTRLSTPRGRIVAVHRPGLKLGVRGPAKCRIISSEERGGLVYDEAELGARGTLYNMNVERRRDSSIAKYGPRSRV